MTKFFEVLSDAFELAQLFVVFTLTGALLVGGVWFAILMGMMVSGQALPIWLP